MKNYYYILGIEITSSQKEITTAYRKLSLKFHPDKNAGDKFFEERFKEINEANEILGNPEKRKKYDSEFLGSEDKVYEKPKIIKYYANKQTAQSGEVVEFHWETKFADSVEIIPFGIVQTSGTKKYKINLKNKKLQCTLIAKNSYGETHQNIYIDLLAEKPVLPKILEFGSDKYLTFQNGFIELSWQTEDADKVTINLIGKVSESGTSTIRVNFGLSNSYNILLVASNKFGESTKSIDIKLSPEKLTTPKDNDNGFVKFVFYCLILFFVILYFSNYPKPEKKAEIETLTSVDTNLTDNAINEIPAKLQIVNIDVKGKFTVLSLKYNNGNSGWVQINKEMYLNVEGQKFGIIDSPDIPFSPAKYEFTESNQDIEFKLVFPSIGDALYFDLVESESGGSSFFNFYNVSVNRPKVANWENGVEKNIESIGTVMFWTKIKEGGKLTVRIGDDNTREITVYHTTNDIPVCGEKGFAVFELKAGSYRYRVESEVMDSLGKFWAWEGLADVKAGSCQKIELSNN